VGLSFLEIMSALIVVVLVIALIFGWNLTG
jgi:hypothetical protein